MHAWAPPDKETLRGPPAASAMHDTEHLIACTGCIPLEAVYFLPCVSHGLHQSECTGTGVRVQQTVSCSTDTGHLLGMRLRVSDTKNQKN
jgi:hypothetical protein